MRLLVFILAVCLTHGALADAAKVNNVRVWAAPDSTRVVFDMSRPVEHNVIMLKNPFRAVIDLRNSDFDAGKVDKPDSSDHYLQRIRTGVHKNDLRIVLDLKKFAKTKIFQLPPNKRYGHRLVVDLFDSRTQPVKSMERADSASGPRPMVVAIDAGHGGEDPGAIGPHGTREKDVVLAVARDLAKKINAVHGMKAVLIRKGDYYIPLVERFQKAREQRADLFVSIHADAFYDHSVRGSSVYVLSKRGATSQAAKWLAARENDADLVGGVKLSDKDELLAKVLLDLSQSATMQASEDVAESVLKGLSAIGPTHKDQVERANFVVLRSPDVPSLLVETAFITNPSEERRLNDPRHRDRLASAILSGVIGYFANNPPPDTLIARSGLDTHVVSRGDTLSEIASQYNVSLNSLRAANGLNSDVLYVGSVLKIPPS